VQYTIEKLFAVRKTKFRDNPGVVPELDLVEDQDKITHGHSLEDDDLETED
jgi:pre-mRNA-splicing factor CWC22